MEKELQNLLLYPSKNSSMKIAIMILFPLSIISFIFSCNHEFCHSFFNQLHSFKSSLNKKTIFCFFNAILLFLVKDFGFLASKTEQLITVPQSSECFSDLKGKNQKPSSSSGKELVAEAKQLEKMEPELMEEEEVGGEMGELGIDELNRKFEEFIERFKMERKMEALQKLMV